MDIRTQNMQLKKKKRKTIEMKKEINLHHYYISFILFSYLKVYKSNKFFKNYYALNLNWIF